MSHESAFFAALACTFALTFGVIAYLHTPLKKLLLSVCESAERVAFWSASADVILLLSPLLGLLLSRGAYSHSTDIADFLLGSLFGLVIAVGLIVGIVAIVNSIEPTWEARIVPKDQREDLKRLLSKVDAMRAREVLVREAEPEPHLAHTEETRRD